jgi:cell wall-associated NlpC family hydrolase
MLPALRLFALVAALGALAPAAALAVPSADDELSTARSELDDARAQVQRLDDRTEHVTERYNRAVWRLEALARDIDDATARLVVERGRLRDGRALLAELIVASYKGIEPGTAAILLGAGSLSDVTSGLELQERFRETIAEATERVRRATEAIAAERARLEAAREEVAAERAALAQTKRELMERLRERRALVEQLGARVNLLTAAEAASASAAEAEDIRRWLRADLRVNRDDPAAAAGDRVALDSLDQLGIPYVWAGATPEGGFDCSGLTMWLWARQAVTLPHYAAAQFGLGPTVERDELRPGDLVYFNDLGHVGVYVGNGWVVHAPRTGDVVKLAPLDSGWFAESYVGATRPGAL